MLARCGRPCGRSAGGDIQADRRSDRVAWTGLDGLTELRERGTIARVPGPFGSIGSVSDVVVPHTRSIDRTRGTIGTFESTEGSKEGKENGPIKETIGPMRLRAIVETARPRSETGILAFVAG